MQHRPSVKPALGRQGRLSAARIVYAAMALVSVILGSGLAWHYPLGGFAAIAVLFGLAAAMYWQPWLWLVMLPGLLPLIGWAPWTGWLTFEELDLLIFAVAAAGYTQLAFRPALSQSSTKAEANSGGRVWPGWVLAGLFSLSTLWSVQRGFADAGGFVFGWFQGYHEAMNSVRLGKSLFLALLMWPLWRAHARHRLMTPWGLATAGSLWAAGTAIGLGGVALTTIWERMAFTGLLNFAADYRTTGMFWEMHVGGAALDGYLMLTVPFALHLLLLARKPIHWAAAGVALGLGLYACLTTFSRGVYLALPAGLVVMLSLHYRQQRRLALAAPEASDSRTAGLAAAIWPGVAMVFAYAISAARIFPTSGYRGALAVMGAWVALPMLAHQVRRLRLTTWVMGVLLALLLVASILGGFSLAPKSGYVSFALSFAACIGEVTWTRRQASRGAKHKRPSLAAALGIASYGGMLVASGLVFYHWGDAVALQAGLPVLGLLALALPLFSAIKTPLWPATLRWHAVVAACMLMALMVVGVFSGGDYIENRFTTGREDMGVRVQHWQQAMNLLADDEEFQWGKGMGRYPANLYMNGSLDDREGDLRLVQEEGNDFVVLSGSLRGRSKDQVLRFSQRVGSPQGKVTLALDVRTVGDAVLMAEICPKHLLYTDYACLSNQLIVKGKGNEWQHMEIPLQGDGLSRGPWFAPKFLAFSVAVASANSVVAIDKLQLRDASGANLLSNADFSQGLAHWFFTSDRNHLPWHIKSMPLNVIFDQGWLGLVLFGGLSAIALWRLSWGATRTHALAPAIAGAISGFWMVGLFDSLLDVPRVAFLFYFLILLAIGSTQGPAHLAGRIK